MSLYRQTENVPARLHYSDLPLAEWLASKYFLVWR